MTSGSIGRVPLPPNDRQYEIQSLNAMHQEMLRMALVGEKYSAIADALGVTNQTVTYVLNSNLGRRALQTMEAARNASTVDVANQIMEMQPKALAVLDEIMDDKDSGAAQRVKVALGILDRTGMGVTKNINMANVNNGFFDENDLSDIKNIAAMAKKNALREGMMAAIEDAEVVDNDE